MLGLHALQHRGQEAAGIVTYDNGQFIAERHAGLVGDVFGRNSGAAANLRGHYAVGHVRYSTAGGSHARNIQPIFADLAGGGLAVAHNGNLTNAHTLRTELVSQGAIFQSTSDTETIVHLAARSKSPRIVDKLIDALRQVEGAYSLVALTSKKLIGVRDPYGVRPLVLGMLEGAPILASETWRPWISSAPNSCAISRRARWWSALPKGSKAIFPSRRSSTASACLNISILRARISTLEGRNVYEARKRIGNVLAEESPVIADMGGAGARFRRARGAGFRQQREYPLRAGHHPQPLCRPHFHRAVGAHPPSGRAPETFAQPRQAEGPACRAGG